MKLMLVIQGVHRQNHARVDDQRREQYTDATGRHRARDTVIVTDPQWTENNIHDSPEAHRHVRDLVSRW